MPDRAIIVGAGVGGLVAALELATMGFAVTVLERAADAGGKVRQIVVGGQRVDAGPTVFTMPWVFAELFDDLGLTLSDHLRLRPVEIIARHAWSEGERLDLYADPERSVAAIGAFAGAAEARAYRAFSRTAASLHAVLKPTFMHAEKPSMIGLAARMAQADPRALFLVNPQASLWSTLKSYFRDPRLIQLFGRYATYCGASPYSASATLMLVAHVETEGVYSLDGGMAELPRTLARLARRAGAEIRYGTEVAAIETRGGRACGVRLGDGARLDAEAVVFNGDAQAIATGLLGPDVRPAVEAFSARQRSLSAMATTLSGRLSGFPLVRHNVFFSADYRAEFDDIFTARRLPRAPTVYVCAQDRHDGPPPDGARAPERALVLVNAPATGDTHTTSEAETEACWESTITLLSRCGLVIEAASLERDTTDPSGFHRLFPATGGALYGRASHGSLSAFQRPGSRTAIPGLYLCGGSVHPGPGVPMAALSARLAVASLVADRGLIRTFHPVATSGGTSTR
ncbi:MAG: phytoene desaturase family protein [Hyphomicrobiaceae bacterium]|nr:phytoene desaturase family protein [Hyphomicrobiaceae bacterium]